MKALVLEENRKLVFKDVETPKTSLDEPYLVRVKYAGICGSDIPRYYHNKAYHYPLVMGHEFSGVIEEGPSSGKFVVGDQVVLYPLTPCMRCPSCEIGEFAQCNNYNYYGSRRDGGFAQYITTCERNLFLVPKRTSLRSAAMTEPCAVALHGVSKFRIDLGQTGLVIGAGPIGNVAAQLMKIKGLNPVYIADIDERKLEIAASMGLETINSKTQDITKIISSKTGYGADCVLEACGLPQTIDQSITCCAPFGQVVFLGNLHGTASLNEEQYSSILRKELTLKGTWNSKATPKGQSEWDTILSLIDSKLQVSPLISHEPHISNGSEMFEKIASREIWYNKIIFSLSTINTTICIEKG